MRFSKYLRDYVKLDILEEKSIDIDTVKCQYNCDRFVNYRKFVKSETYEILSILNSPHYGFLSRYIKNGDIKNIRKQRYYRMHASYGKKKKWIYAKLRKFLCLYEDIRVNGITELPIVLTEPVVANRYNDGLEIYEGHHRLSCLYALGFKKVNVLLSRPIRMNEI